MYKASCWDCDSFYVGKTKRRLHDRKTEHFKALTQDCHASALIDHVISTGHNIKWDPFEILTTEKSDLQCKIKETLLISELKPSFLNVCNSYNRSLLKMYVVAYETSSNTENFYYTMRCLWIMSVTVVCFFFLLLRPMKSDKIRHVTSLEKQLKMGCRNVIQSLSNLVFL